MELRKIAYALNSDLRLRIIGLLCKEDMTANEVISKLKENAPRYRQSIYKALEILHTSGLVEKYYNDTTKALRYGIVKK